jgi:hypothetical protein
VTGDLTSKLGSQQAAQDVAGRRELDGDISLSLLLATQVLVTFVVVPIGALWTGGHWLLDLGRLLFAALCSLALTSRRSVRAALLGSLVVLAAGPPLWDRLGTSFGLSFESRHGLIGLTAFGFNALVTALVFRSTFGPGRITVHRVLGAVLVYLNVAVLFAIGFDLLDTWIPGAISNLPQQPFVAGRGARTAELSYFSLSTITCMGYGDLAPVHPLARSLANFEGVFGQLFPPIFLARLVGLHLAQGDAGA